MKRRIEKKEISRKQTNGKAANRMAINRNAENLKLINRRWQSEISQGNNSRRKITGKLIIRVLMIR